jgi:uracil-DNA glycosylase family 4
MISSHPLSPQSDELSSAEWLDMLKFQLESGVDECLLDEAVGAVQEDNHGHNYGHAAGISGVSADAASSSASPLPSAAAVWHDCASLADLKDAAEQWTGSDLKRTAMNMVFADGNPDAAVMLVGEAPGADEDRQGKPFVGVSGKLLDLMLASIGLNRNKVYITNILLWRPPGNRTPTAEESALFLPLIRRHIELVQPKLLVAIGGSATKTLLGRSDGILKMRGQWHDFDTGGEAKIPLLPTLHPAYLLRTPQQKALAWQDWRQLYRKCATLNIDLCKDGEHLS